MLELEVLDKNTMNPLPEEVIVKIAKQNQLIYCDIEGFAISEDGSLYLLDECGNYCYIAPNGLYVVRLEFGGHTFEFDY